MTRGLMTGLLTVATLAAMLVVPALAHEGHEHHVMGTVSMLHDTQLEVKGTDGTTSTFTLDDQTKIMRGTTMMKMTDIKRGDRVVVTTEEEEAEGGKTMMMVKEVRLGEDGEHAGDDH